MKLSIPELHFAVNDYID